MDNQTRGLAGLTRLLPILLGLLAVGFMAMRGCQSGPFGRKQVVLLSPQEEVRLGAQAFVQVLDKEGSNVLMADSPVDREVKTVAARLIRATSNPKFLQLTQQKDQSKLMAWDVRVVRSKQINAFCLPGGKIVVYTAILPVCQTDAGLATVMGHEIAHALAHHGAERMAQTQMAKIGLTAASGSLGEVSPVQREGIMRALNAGAQFGILKYSRNHESEADKMGLFLMAAAGYPPRESFAFWERMSKATGGSKGTPEFMSTHPSHGTRIQNLQEWQTLAEPLYRESGRQESPRLLSTGTGY